MILAVDVDYRDDYAVCAGVSFASWSAEKPDAIYRSFIEKIKPYEPGKFYKRELPCILELLEEHKPAPQIIIVDSYVFLDGSSRPGLGKYLYDALGQEIPVIGVAKNPFHEISNEYAISRHNSSKPLYVTCTGYDLEKAKEHVLAMHGEFRIPTMLKLVDQECRKQC